MSHLHAWTACPFFSSDFFFGVKTRWSLMRGQNQPGSWHCQPCISSGTKNIGTFDFEFNFVSLKGLAHAEIIGEFNNFHVIPDSLSDRSRTIMGCRNNKKVSGSGWGLTIHSGGNIRRPRAWLGQSMFAPIKGRLKTFWGKHSFFEFLREMLSWTCLGCFLEQVKDSTVVLVQAAAMA